MIFCPAMVLGIISAKMNRADALSMATEPDVDYVQQDFAVAPPQRSSVQSNTNVTPAGRVSATSRFTASDGPLLDTVKV